MLSREEIGRLLRAAPESYRDLLATAIFTGLRQSELLAMRWENVDFARGLVRVRTALNRNRQHVPLKTRTSRRDVVLAPALAEQLQVARERSRYPLPSDYVFASKVGTPLHWRNISRRALQPALADAGLPHLRWHDLRHIYASMLIASGANVIFASRQLGRWSPEVTFRVYSHLFEMTEQADHTRSLVEDLYQHRMGTERASASSQARPKGPLAPASRCS
jgi:integrase